MVSDEKHKDEDGIPKNEDIYGLCKSTGRWTKVLYIFLVILRDDECIARY